MFWNVFGATMLNFSFKLNNLALKWPIWVEVSHTNVGFWPNFNGRSVGPSDHAGLYMIEDDLWWKTTFNGRHTSMVEYLSWKTTFDGRQPSLEENLWWKMIFDWRQARQTLMKDYFQWKTTFDGRRPLTEDDLWQKTTFSGRQPLRKELTQLSFSFFHYSFICRALGWIWWE